MLRDSEKGMRKEMQMDWQMDLMKLMDSGLVKQKVIMMHLETATGRRMERLMERQRVMN